MSLIGESCGATDEPRVCAAIGLLSVVLALVRALMPALNEGPPPAEADLLSDEVYTGHGRIARNVGGGEAIRVCTTDLPNSTGTAIAEINDAPRSAGAATRFNVFRLGEECPARVPTVQDRVDYVQVILPGTTVMVPADLR